jgi:ferredoxin--NADP+ reductase
MSRPGTGAEPLRVAVVGSGPAGFYTAEKLFKQQDLRVEVDIYDRLPVPFGLVRFGVAPDHEKIKNVTRVYDKTAMNPGFRFFGNVDVGTDVTLDDLRDYYHQICYCTGAQTDRQMGIPGEDLERSHPATEFVAWYNGHPDYRDYEFDLSVERVAVVGIGNVAVDVARILSRTRDEPATTDIADYALEALANSNVKEVYILGRRGPAQAAFTNPEVRELGELAGADFTTFYEEVTLDPLSQQSVDASDDKALKKKIELLQGFADRPQTGKPKKLTLRFLVSPVELYDDGAGGVKGMKIVRNELYLSDDGSLRPKHTDTYEELDVDMVFRSVGYRGVPLAGVPFMTAGALYPMRRGVSSIPRRTSLSEASMSPVGSNVVLAVSSAPTSPTRARLWAAWWRMRRSEPLWHPCIHRLRPLNGLCVVRNRSSCLGTTGRAYKRRRTRRVRTKAGRGPSSRGFKRYSRPWVGSDRRYRVGGRPFATHGPTEVAAEGGGSDLPGARGWRLEARRL